MMKHYIKRDSIGRPYETTRTLTPDEVLIQKALLRKYTYSYFDCAVIGIVIFMGVVAAAVIAFSIFS